MYKNLSPLPYNINGSREWYHIIFIEERIRQEYDTLGAILEFCLPQIFVELPWIHYLAGSKVCPISGPQFPCLHRERTKLGYP